MWDKILLVHLSWRITIASASAPSEPKGFPPKSSPSGVLYRYGHALQPCDRVVNSLHLETAERRVLDSIGRGPAPLGADDYSAMVRYSVTESAREPHPHKALPLT